MKYYHITRNSEKIISSILSEGLKDNEEGDIFLFENKSFGINGIINNVADHIAANQIFLNKYVMFEVDTDGINGDLIPDRVADYSAKFQWIAKQPIIEAKHINIFGIFKTEYKNPFNQV